MKNTIIIFQDLSSSLSSISSDGVMTGFYLMLILVISVLMFLIVNNKLTRRKFISQKIKQQEKHKKTMEELSRAEEKIDQWRIY